MPLPSSWVDALFAKLTVRWGAAFMRQWPDADPAHVKSDWAEALDGVSGDSIAYALRYLPTAPCNALAFRDVCRRAPAVALPALSYHGVRADQAVALPALSNHGVRAHQAVVQAVVEGLAARQNALQTPAQQCADAILATANGIGRMRPVQQQQIAAMAHLLTPEQREQAARFVPALAPAAAAVAVAELEVQ